MPKSPELRKVWEQRIADYRKSGQTQANWCKENQLSIHQFKYWLRKIEKSDAQIAEWVKKFRNGESFKDQRGVWNRKHFSSLEEENAYLKAQVEYQKKRNPNLHGKEWS
jgi:hypothetical protein